MAPGAATSSTRRASLPGVQLVVVGAPRVCRCRRYHVHGSGEPVKPVLLRLVAVVLSAIGFSLSYTERAPIAIPIIFIGRQAGAP